MVLTGTRSAQWREPPVSRVPARTRTDHPALWPASKAYPGPDRRGHLRTQPLRPPRRRVIVALDIENSTSRPDPAKAELRIMLCELFDAALRSAGIGARRRSRFTDRGDGLLALVNPADQELLFSLVIPVSGHADDHLARGTGGACS
jgi:hypothetical protein